MTPQNHCSLWLMPDQASVKKLNASIISAATKLGTPVFNPHLTVLGDLPHNSDDVTKRCSEFMFPTLDATVTQVSTSPQFFMALFLELDVSDQWRTLQTALGKSLSEKAAPFRPHISIAYGRNLSVEHIYEEQEKLKADFIGKEISFESLAVVASSQQLPIDQWQLLQTFKLHLSDVR